MKKFKENQVYIYFFVCLLTFVTFPKVSLAVDSNDLADICQAMENAIVDISLEYEWYLEPPMTKEEIAGTNNLMPVGHYKQSLMTKTPFNEHYLFTQKTVYMDEHGKSYEDTRKISYNDGVAKLFQSGGLPLNGKLAGQPLRGVISRQSNFLGSLNISPIGFSVFRFQIESEKSLSGWLRMAEFTRINNRVQKINDFNAICAELLTLPEFNKQVYRRIYFAVDYGYTPIRYEYFNGPKVGGTIDINSLQEVQKGLWFPSSGFIRDSDPGAQTNVYRATNKIIVNREFKDENFDIEFPPGTKVADEITGGTYTIRPMQEQVDKSLPK